MTTAIREAGPYMYTYTTKPTTRRADRPKGSRR